MEKTITVKIIEYQKLRQIKERYEIMRNLFTMDFFEEPAEKDVKKIIGEFKEIKKYGKKFSNSLEKGLKEPS